MSTLRLSPEQAQCLARALDRAELRAVELHFIYADAAAGQQPWPAGALHDHREDAAGDLADALDELSPGAGGRLMAILFPENHAVVDNALHVQPVEQAIEQIVAAVQARQVLAADAPQAAPLLQ